MSVSMILSQKDVFYKKYCNIMSVGVQLSEILNNYIN